MDHLGIDQILLIRKCNHLAFIQVRIKEAERDVLRFHWKPHDDAKVETLRFTCVLFGLTCSPFLLGGVIEHHLKSWEDDLISRKMTVAEAQCLKKRAIEIFDDATFTHKWHSMHPNWKRLIPI